MLGPARSKTRRFLVAIAIGATAVLGVVPAAQAANVVPNWDFENNCAGVPCNWSPTTGVTLQYDTSVKLSGSASMKVTTTAPQGGNGATSDCVPLSPGPLTRSFWYRTTDAGVASIQRGEHFYASMNCALGTYIGGSMLNTTLPAHDTSWHLISDTDTAPVNTQAVEIYLLVNKGTANFDNVLLDGTPLAVTLTSFRAARSHKGVVLRWRTGTEADTLGFNVYRQLGSRRVRVNRRLLPALGAVAGSSYSFRDSRAPRHRAARYWLEDVSTSGVRTSHGPARVAATA